MSYWDSRGTLARNHAIRTDPDTPGHVLSVRSELYIMKFKREKE